MGTTDTHIFCLFSEYAKTILSPDWTPEGYENPMFLYPLESIAISDDALVANTWIDLNVQLSSVSFRPCHAIVSG